MRLPTQQHFDEPLHSTLQSWSDRIPQTLLRRFSLAALRPTEELVRFLILQPLCLYGKSSEQVQCLMVADPPEALPTQTLARPSVE